MAKRKWQIMHHPLSSIEGAIKEILGFEATLFVYIGLWKCAIVKFIYSEKATHFSKISTVDLSYLVEILQNCIAFSEYMNFTSKYV
jgi:hypothetical protein